MEPVYMVLVQSAGVAAVLAMDSNRAVQDIDIKQLLRELEKDGQVLHRSMPAPLPAH
jgi:hypothetical protein